MNVQFLSASREPQTPPTPLVPETPRHRFSVDGLAPGMAPASATYEGYSCEPSEQYPPSIRCRSEKVDGGVRTSKTIYRSPEGIISYVNKAVSPAFSKDSDVDAEIERLSDGHGSPSNTYRSPDWPGVPHAVIATWGEIELRPLSPADLDLLAQGRDRGHGVLVDFLGDFTQSAKLRLPVYSIAGGEGFVWIASFDQTGKGNLRFFAADPSQMKRAAPEGRSATRRDRDLAICRGRAAEWWMQPHVPPRGLLPWLFDQGQREEEKAAIINACMAERGW
jgi:hypothetical protein